MVLLNLLFLCGCIFFTNINTVSGISESRHLVGEWSYGFISGYILSSLSDVPWECGFQANLTDEWVYGNVLSNLSHNEHSENRTINNFFCTLTPAGNDQFSNSNPENNLTNNQWNYGYLQSLLTNFDSSYQENTPSTDGWVYGNLNESLSNCCLRTCNREQCGYCCGCGLQTLCCECDKQTTAESTTSATTETELNELSTTPADILTRTFTETTTKTNPDKSSTWTTTETTSETTNTWSTTGTSSKASSTWSTTETTSGTTGTWSTTDTTPEPTGTWSTTETTPDRTNTWSTTETTPGKINTWSTTEITPGTTNTWSTTEIPITTFFSSEDTNIASTSTFATTLSPTQSTCNDTDEWNYCFCNGGEWQCGYCSSDEWQYGFSPSAEKQYRSNGSQNWNNGYSNQEDDRNCTMTNGYSSGSNKWTYGYLQILLNSQHRLNNSNYPYCNYCCRNTPQSIDHLDISSWTYGYSGTNESTSCLVDGIFNVSTFNLGCCPCNCYNQNNTSTTESTTLEITDFSLEFSTTDFSIGSSSALTFETSTTEMKASTPYTTTETTPERTSTWSTTETTPETTSTWSTKETTPGTSSTWSTIETTPETTSTLSSTETTSDKTNTWATTEITPGTTNTWSTKGIPVTTTFFSSEDTALASTSTLSTMLTPTQITCNDTDEWNYCYCNGGEWQYGYCSSAEWQYGYSSSIERQYISSDNQNWNNGCSYQIGVRNGTMTYGYSTEKNEWVYGFLQMPFNNQHQHDSNCTYCNCCCQNTSQFIDRLDNSSWTYGYSGTNESTSCLVDRVLNVSSFNVGCCLCTCCNENMISTSESTTLEITTDFSSEFSSTDFSIGSSSMLIFEMSTAEMKASTPYTTTETTPETTSTWSTKETSPGITSTWSRTETTPETTSTLSSTETTPETTSTLSSTETTPATPGKTNTWATTEITPGTTNTWSTKEIPVTKTFFSSEDTTLALTSTFSTMLPPTQTTCNDTDECNYCFCNGGEWQYGYCSSDEWQYGYSSSIERQYSSNDTQNWNNGCSFQIGVRNGTMTYGYSTEKNEWVYGFLQMSFNNQHQLHNSNFTYCKCCCQNTSQFIDRLDNSSWTYGYSGTNESTSCLVDRVLNVSSFNVGCCLCTCCNENMTSTSESTTLEITTDFSSEFSTTDFSIGSSSTLTFEMSTTEMKASTPYTTTETTPERTSTWSRKETSPGITSTWSTKETTPGITSTWSRTETTPETTSTLSSTETTFETTGTWSTIDTTFDKTNTWATTETTPGTTNMRSTKEIPVTKTFLSSEDTTLASTSTLSTMLPPTQITCNDTDEWNYCYCNGGEWQYGYCSSAEWQYGYSSSIERQYSSNDTQNWNNGCSYQIGVRNGTMTYGYSTEENEWVYGFLQMPFNNQHQLHNSNFTYCKCCCQNTSQFIDRLDISSWTYGYSGTNESTSCLVDRVLNVSSFNVGCCLCTCCNENMTSTSESTTLEITTNFSSEFSTTDFSIGSSSTLTFEMSTTEMKASTPYTTTETTPERTSTWSTSETTPETTSTWSTKETTPGITSTWSTKETTPGTSSTWSTIETTPETTSTLSSTETTSDKTNTWATTEITPGTTNTWSTKGIPVTTTFLSSEDTTLALTSTFSTMLPPTQITCNDTDEWNYCYCNGGEWQYGYCSSAEWQYGYSSSIERQYSSNDTQNWNNGCSYQIGVRNGTMTYGNSTEKNEWVYGFLQMPFNNQHQLHNSNFTYCKCCCQNTSQFIDRLDNSSWTYGYSGTNESTSCLVDRVLNVSSFNVGCCLCTCCNENMTSTSESTTLEITTDFPLEFSTIKTTPEKTSTWSTTETAPETTSTWSTKETTPGITSTRSTTETSPGTSTLSSTQTTPGTPSTWSATETTPGTPSTWSATETTPETTSTTKPTAISTEFSSRDISIGSLSTTTYETSTTEVTTGTPYATTELAVPSESRTKELTSELSTKLSSTSEKIWQFTMPKQDQSTWTWESTTDSPSQKTTVTTPKASVMSTGNGGQRQTATTTSTLLKEDTSISDSNIFTTTTVKTLQAVQDEEAVNSQTYTIFVIAAIVCGVIILIAVCIIVFVIKRCKSKVSPAQAFTI